MDTKNIVRVRITHFNLCWLRHLHTCYIIRADNNHQILLHEFSADFTKQFDRLIQRDKKTYTLKFSSLQALAFIQLWVDYPLQVDASVLINSIIATIDKKSKDAQVTLTPL